MAVKLFFCKTSGVFGHLSHATVAAPRSLPSGMGCNSRKRGCDGIFVQAPPSDASRLQRFFSIFWHCVFFLLVVSEEWERLYCKYVDLHKAVNLKKPGNNERRKDKWGAYYGRRSERQLRVELQCEKRCGRRM